jgi:flagellar hook-associated protein 3 FlgL
MSTVQNKLTQTQAQLAQGKQIINASDSPNQAATIQRLKSILNRQESYQSSLNTVKARLEGEDSTLRSVSDLLVRAITPKGSMGKAVSRLSPAVFAKHARILIQVGLSITQN